MILSIGGLVVYTENGFGLFLLVLHHSHCKFHNFILVLIDLD